MRFHSFVSDLEPTAEAFGRVIDDARAATGGKVDAAFVFFTAHHRGGAEAGVEKLWLDLDPQAVVGCSAEGVIGGDVEIERAPGLSPCSSGEMPGVRLHPFHVAADQWEALLDDEDDFRHRLGQGPETRALIGLGDPFTTPLNELLAAVDRFGPGCPLVGGMASAARSPGGNLLVRNDQSLTDGLVGLSPRRPGPRRHARQPGVPPGRQADGRHQGEGERDRAARRQAGAGGAPRDRRGTCRRRKPSW